MGFCWQCLSLSQISCFNRLGSISSWHFWDIRGGTEYWRDAFLSSQKACELSQKEKKRLFPRVHFIVILVLSTSNIFQGWNWKQTCVIYFIYSRTRNRTCQFHMHTQLCWEFKFSKVDTKKNWIVMKSNRKALKNFLTQWFFSIETNDWKLFLESIALHQNKLLHEKKRKNKN